MKREELRAFVERGWARAERSKKGHWARRRREEGPDALLRAASILLEHMRSVRQDWPRPEEREADLAHHIELNRLLERASTCRRR